MAILGIILGIVVFFIVGAVASPMLGNTQVGYLPGLLAGVLIAGLFWQRASKARNNFLHPAPKEYRRSKPVVFKCIRDLLAETNVEYGDTWVPRTADTTTGRIVADLRYAEEESKFQLDSRNNPQVKKERVKRFLRLEAQMKTTDNDTTIVQLDWIVKVQGLNPWACDYIISNFSESLDSALSKLD